MPAGGAVPSWRQWLARELVKVPDSDGYVEMVTDTSNLGQTVASGRMR